MRDVLRQRLFFSLKYLIGLFLLFWILAKVDRYSMLETLLTLEANTIFFVLLFALFNLSLQFNLWKFLIQSQSHSFEFRDLLPSFFSGFAFRLMIPGGHAEISKIFLLKGRKRGKIIAFGVEKIFQTALKVVLVAFALPLVFPEYQSVLWAVGVFIILTFVALPYFLKKEKIKKWQEKDASYVKIFVTSLFHSIPIFLCISTQYFFMLNQSFDISFFDTMIVAVFIWGAGLLPISVSGLGVRENLAVFFLAQYNVPGFAAVGISLFVFFINAIIPALIGAVMIVKRRHDIKEAGGEMRRISKSVYQKGKERINGRKKNQQESIPRQNDDDSERMD